MRIGCYLLIEVDHDSHHLTCVHGEHVIMRSSASVLAWMICWLVRMVGSGSPFARPCHTCAPTDP